MNKLNTAGLCAAVIDELRKDYIIAVTELNDGSGPRREAKIIHGDAEMLNAIELNDIATNNAPGKYFVTGEPPTNASPAQPTLDDFEALNPAERMAFIKSGQRLAGS